MKVGIFLPIANNGFLVSHNAPQYHPSFAHNRKITLAAERFGLDFVMSMVRFKGYGGETEHWDYALESFTLMAGLAAVTEKISLIASTAILTVPPTVIARMAVTIDSIAPGRFGVNIVSGWSDAEYESMGIWPGSEHFANRYARAAEYVTILRQLWSTGSSTLDGAFYKTKDAQCLPLPKHVTLVGAGQSDDGLGFAARYTDYNFAMATGSDPLDFRPSMDRLAVASAAAQRDVGTYGGTMIITAETDEAAQAKWDHYKAGVDYTAFAGLAAIINKNTAVASNSSTPLLADPAKAVSMGGVPVVGSYETIARRLDEVAETGVAGVMICFDDYVQGVEDFGRHIQPKMKSRAHVMAAAD